MTNMRKAIVRITGKGRAQNPCQGPGLQMDASPASLFSNMYTIDCRLSIQSSFTYAYKKGLRHLVDDSGPAAEVALVNKVLGGSLAVLL